MVVETANESPNPGIVIAHVATSEPGADEESNAGIAEESHAIGEFIANAKQDIPDLLSALDAAEEEIERMPHTQDGVLIVPGMTLWAVRSPMARPKWVEKFAADMIGKEMAWQFGAGPCAHFKDCYSTEALAREACNQCPTCGAAAKGGDKGGAS